VTATNFDNKAKIYGGGDPGKPSLTSTGTVSACSSNNEGYSGGGALYFGGASTSAGCAFENTLISRQANLSVAKTNGTTSLVASSSTTYSVTYVNAGPSAASNAIVQDTPSSGLSGCTVNSCTVAGSPATATCPVVPNNLLAAGGTTIPVFPSNSSITFSLICSVAATGL
jgi:uncharacterized repeat protein (TIGR01451 family)